MNGSQKNIRALFFSAMVIVVALLTFGLENMIFTVYGEHKTTLPENFTAAQAANLTYADIQRDMEFWKVRIDEIGPELAREELKRRYAAAKYRFQHRVAHAFGGILFEKYGLEGIPYCDNMFGFGCYHQFFGGAMRGGLTVLPELDAACSSLAPNPQKQCFHGIGHGLVGFLGYDASALVVALNNCDVLHSDNSGPCYGGAFMEYNLRFLRHEADSIFSSDIRPLSDDPHELCTTLPKIYRNSCYWQLPAWWRAAYNNDLEKIGSLCAIIADAPGRQACFFGMGEIAALFSTYRSDMIVQICNLAPNEGVTFCRIGGAKIIWEHLDDSSRAKELCTGLTHEDTELCLRKISEFIEQLPRTVLSP